MGYTKGIDVSQCVIATGTPDATTGYIRKSRNNVIRYAHRLAYSDAYGDIPHGLQIHHRCDNKLCINPKHLQAVTKAEHQVIHSHPKSAAYYAQLKTCKRGHPLDGKNDRQRFCITCKRKAAREYLQRKRESNHVVC